jgi:hypothetical protein
MHTDVSNWGLWVAYAPKANAQPGQDQSVRLLMIWGTPKKKRDDNLRSHHERGTQVVMKPSNKLHYDWYNEELSGVNRWQKWSLFTWQSSLRNIGLEEGRLSHPQNALQHLIYSTLSRSLFMYSLPLTSTAHVLAFQEAHIPHIPEFYRLGHHPSSERVHRHQGIELFRASGRPI